MYTVSPPYSDTVTVRVFSPSVQVALPPFVTVVVPFLITIVASASVAVAVTLLDAFDVVAVYSVTSLENVGVSVNDPIASPDRVVILLPLRQRFRLRRLPAQPH